jgi:hypothetical protein
VAGELSGSDAAPPLVLKHKLRFECPTPSPDPAHEKPVRHLPRHEDLAGKAALDGKLDILRVSTAVGLLCARPREVRRQLPRFCCGPVTAGRDGQQGNDDRNPAGASHGNLLFSPMAIRARGDDA